MPYNFLVIWFPLQWHHMKWMASSMAPLYSLGEDDQNEIQHDFFGHLMPLALALTSCDADSIINGTIAFLSLRQLNLDTTWFFDNVIPLVLASHNTSGIVIGTWYWCKHWYCHWHKKSYNPSKPSSQHNKCNCVIDGTINILLLPYTWQKLICP